MVRLVMLLAFGLLASCGEILSVPTVDDRRPEPQLSSSSPTAAVASAPSATSAAAAQPGSAASAVTPPADAGCTPTEHVNGVGQTYLSCAALETWNEAAAWAACEAYVAGGTGGFCQLRSGGTCAGRAVVSIGMIARSATNAAWDFGTAARGHVETYPDAAPIGCPGIEDPTWN